MTNDSSIIDPSKTAGIWFAMVLDDLFQVTTESTQFAMSAVLEDIFVVNLCPTVVFPTIESSQ